MSTYAWLILAFPLGGMLLIALTWRLLPQRAHGVIGTLAIALSFVSSVLLFSKLQGSDVKQVTVHGWDYAKTVGLDAEVSLLVAAVGAVILARRRAGIPDTGEVSVADIMRSREATLSEAPPETMLEAGGPAGR